MGEEPAGVGPRDGGGAVEPEFVAASAEEDALDRAAPATPPVTNNLTHTLCPMPLESPGRLHALLDPAWRWSGHGARAAVGLTR